MEIAELRSLNYIDFGNFVWINIDSPSAEILDHLRSHYSFHHLDIEDCLSKTQMPKIDEYADYLFIILHVPRFKKDRKYSIPEQVSIFLGKGFLVTVHSGEIKPIAKLFESYAAEGENSDCSGAGNHVGCDSPPLLLYKLVRTIAQNLTAMLGKVIFNLEQIEEKVFDDKIDAAREVTELRHDIANMRRIVLPLMRVVHDLEKKVGKFAGEDMGIYFSDLADSMDKAWAIIEECKEMIEIYKDTDFIMSSDRTNRILALLTILFTFSIPFTVIGTMFGMNVTLPGGIDRPWSFLGPYTAFIVLVSASAVPVFLMYIIFKRLRWL